jgi:hypothetical protein
MMEAITKMTMPYWKRAPVVAVLKVRASTALLMTRGINSSAGGNPPEGDRKAREQFPTGSGQNTLLMAGKS